MTSQIYVIIFRECYQAVSEGDKSNTDVDRDNNVSIN